MVASVGKVRVRLAATGLFCFATGNRFAGGFLCERFATDFFCNRSLIREGPEALELMVKES